MSALPLILLLCLTVFVWAVAIVASIGDDEETPDEETPPETKQEENEAAGGRKAA
ncbi:hypothetical protein [Nitrospira moscoviensis]|jgi:hypothetical protein|uniref:Uncharacterized protein n=1 Tax=Nitrospira moscoviensis TaxID=42253 RepID=A0A0K2GFU4_NITMO|nr:hypothetical protein [Nitrospira moscoviensis]ALA59724.1 exported protein of unknown function [Nitrospira moscoviensis]